MLGWRHQIAAAAAELVGLSVQSIVPALRGRIAFRTADIVALMRESGPGALSIITIVNVLVGGILAFVGALQLKRFGAGIFVSDLLGIATIRETAPIMTAIAMTVVLARVLWLQGFPDQARMKATEALEKARITGHPLAVSYTLTIAAIPVALWSGAPGEARAYVALLAAQSKGNHRLELWARCLAGITRLRDGNTGERLIASFIEARVDVASIVSLAQMASETNTPVPLPGEEPARALWNTPEILRVDAELLLWHDAPGAVAAAEARLLRALEISQQQTALSWELRAATSLARLWRGQERISEARDLLAATYGKFTEGFDTNDLTEARRLLNDLTLPRG